MDMYSIYIVIQGGATVRNRVPLMKITPISLGFMVDIPILNGGYKPTYYSGAPPCSSIEVT
jgi:hypothetical protein